MGQRKKTAVVFHFPVRSGATRPSSEPDPSTTERIANILTTMFRKRKEKTADDGEEKKQ